MAGQAGSEAVAGFRVRSVDAVGAGDAFVAALAVTLAAGVAPAAALRAACAAGATATTRQGAQAALPRPAEIRAATSEPWPVLSVESQA
jgi:ribokinase